MLRHDLRHGGEVTGGKSVYKRIRGSRVFGVFYEHVSWHIQMAERRARESAPRRVRDNVAWKTQTSSGFEECEIIYER